MSNKRPFIRIDGLSVGVRVDSDGHVALSVWSDACAAFVSVQVEQIKPEQARELAKQLFSAADDAQEQANAAASQNKAVAA